MPRNPKGWVLETVVADKTAVGMIARGYATSFVYKTQSSQYWTVNVAHCDGAVLFGNPQAELFYNIRGVLERDQKPYTVNPTVAELQDFILSHGVTKLFVYGPDTKAIREQVDTVLRAGLLPF